MGNLNNKCFKIYALLLVSLIGLLFTNCEKEEKKWIINDYKGSYKNVTFTESLISDFSPGIYYENEIPSELKQLEYGKIEIDFNYNGGALESFMPLLYFGSINKNKEDDVREETQFHLVVEIGHYNVVPFPLENLFYTVCYDRYPLYCRDTDSPVIAGEDYTFVIEKRPDGNVIQLKKGEEIVNSFPSAFFPDSTQLFFNNVTQKIDEIRGDSLDLIMMLGKGFVGFAPGLHEFNGSVKGMKVYKYTLNDEFSGYEIENIKNQHYVNEQVSYIIKDLNFSEGNTLKLKYDFFPYSFSSGKLVPDGETKYSELIFIKNNKELTYNITKSNIGLYKLYLETYDDQNNVVNSSITPFEVWVYPERWEFDY